MKKILFRKQCLARLKYIRSHTHRQKDYVVNRSLYRMIKRDNVRTILLYVPLGIEVNINPLIRRLRQEKRLLYVPFMEGESFSLVKYRLPLQQKQFGIKEPKYSKQYRIKKIDLAIVPIVGTDPTLRRVGFGKGMYDRFFERERKNINKTVFVSRRLCLAHQVVTNHYDIPADMLMTPEKILYRKSSQRI
ncbi:MAG TPA: 5-formyltetrahydrofolate cyclo-ligase [Epsilonproteobacteria bacterium]|nr:5-formyltetrahydrofolate cyclo-ligase [Campylobacterota bacterium]